MQIHRLPNEVGCGIITNHSVYLSEKGYTILKVQLSMLQESDLKSYLPLLMEDKTIKMIESENSINIQIKELHSSGKKVALLLNEYENNQDRLPSIKFFVQNRNDDLFDLNEDDVVFFQANNGISI